MAAKKRKRVTPAQFQARAGYAMATASVVNTLIRWGGGATIAVVLLRIVETLAGRETRADFSVSVLAQMDLLDKAPWVVALAAIVFAERERRLREKQEGRLGRRIKELEELIDSRRSSSRLDDDRR